MKIQHIYLEKNDLTLSPLLFPPPPNNLDRQIEVVTWVYMYVYNYRDVVISDIVTSRLM